MLDGAHGEGGGQIVRTALALAAATGRSVRIERIRANRPRPGLAAQHVAVVRALAAVCGARLVGDALGSSELEFTPTRDPEPGSYEIDIGAARPGGSAGSTTLVLQAMVQALARASGRSTLGVRGGTHVPWSPPFDYVHEVWLPTLARMGILASAELRRWGFHPAGGGELRLTLEGAPAGRIAALDRRDRGTLRRVTGRAASSRIPRHVRERMIRRAYATLASEGLMADVASLEVEAACAGVGLFLTAEYASSLAGFGALGERGKPAERVADEAVSALVRFHRSGAAVDEHLADQLLAIAALSDGQSELAVERVSSHLTTNAWVIEQLGLATISISPRDDGTAIVALAPTRRVRASAQE